jgi:hypothetical protein
MVQREDRMARADRDRRTPGEALHDYERARRLWERLARKQKDDQTTFPLDREFLKDLGFANEDLAGGIRDLQDALTGLQRFTWHWDRRGPLSSRPGEAGPIAYIVDRTLVIAPQFADVRTAFLAYPARRDRPELP